MSKIKKFLELPARDDIYADRGTTKWGNHDLYPIVPKERTYGKGAYLLYWVTCCCGLSTFAIGSSYIAVGLTPGEACGAVLIGACIASSNALLCGRPGSTKHMGYVSHARGTDINIPLTDQYSDYDGSSCFWSAWHVATSVLSDHE
jgi:nucleobase:cation symporter-1, NCS1 family